MNLNRAYLVVTKLIEQPTWGGQFIVKMKGWEKKTCASSLIGQSYELHANSLLSYATNTEDSDFGPEFDTQTPLSIPLTHLIAADTQALLGSKYATQFQGEMKTLIKFTQAKGNSFQLHVPQNTPNARWQQKPESWYFFEDGLATLGISDLSKLGAYQKACMAIERYMQSLSVALKEGTITADQATLRAQTFIAEKNIYSYVNKIIIPANSIVDLHVGGTHHSWEEDDSAYPLGNVLYEVQVDAADDASTLRSFDKGKFTEDGSIRPLHIEDYFKYIDRTPQANNPAGFIKKPDRLYNGSAIVVDQLFSTPYYACQQIEFSGICDNEYVKPAGKTFHHLFSRQGTVVYTDHHVTLTVGEGHSVFVPACVKTYALTAQTARATILKTYSS